jgi:hypothetical protein
MSEQPFPLPKSFRCPYCKSDSPHLGGFDTGSSLVHFSHKIKKYIKVGHKIHVTLETLHQFCIKWVGGEWHIVTEGMGTSKACERVEFGNGDTTDWHGYSDI